MYIYVHYIHAMSASFVLTYARNCCRSEYTDEFNDINAPLRRCWGAPRQASPSVRPSRPWPPSAATTIGLYFKRYTTAFSRIYGVGYGRSTRYNGRHIYLYVCTYKYICIPYIDSIYDMTTSFILGLTRI